MLQQIAIESTLKELAICPILCTKRWTPLHRTHTYNLLYNLTLTSIKLSIILQLKRPNFDTAVRFYPLSSHEYKLVTLNPMQDESRLRFSFMRMIQL